MKYLHTCKSSFYNLVPLFSPEINPITKEVNKPLIQEHDCWHNSILTSLQMSFVELVPRFFVSFSPLDVVTLIFLTQLFSPWLFFSSPSTSSVSFHPPSSSSCIVVFVSSYRFVPTPLSISLCRSFILFLNCIASLIPCLLCISMNRFFSTFYFSLSWLRKWNVMMRQFNESLWTCELRNK